MKDFLLYTMEYCGDNVESFLTLEKYNDCFYDEYKRIYEDCFCEMRTALELYPINAGDSREELSEKKNDIYIYKDKNAIIGSYAIYGNEIDELIVAREYQRQGNGRRLLNSALACMQKEAISPIRLKVVDWNKNALKLYLSNGFKIVKTDSIKQT